MKTFKQYILETIEEGSHAAMTYMGADPHPHMGQAKDIGKTMMSLPGQKFVGLSGKADVLQEERSNILHRQWGSPKDLDVGVVRSAGEVIAKAYHALPEGKKHLHLVFGADRADFAEGLKKSLEAGKIRNMGDHRWDSITIHTPKDPNRSHGMSGTKMRTALANNDFETYHEHLGKNVFSEPEARSYFERLKAANIKVKR